MKVTVLGSGAIMSSTRACSGYLVESENAKAVVDLGSGSFLNLKKTSDVLSIGTILLTHYHPDHASELASFLAYKLVAFKFGDKRSLSQINLIGPKGLNDFIEKIRAAFPILQEAQYRIITKELDNGKIVVPGFKVKSMPMAHDNCIGYRLEAQGRSVTFSGDTAYTKNLVSLAKNVDLLVADCSFPDSVGSAVHMTPLQCANIAKEAEAKALLLSHLYPAVETEPILKIVKSVYKGKTYVANDLFAVEF
ncbi:MAG: MBL fold metallo-hydrolase [Candidatus Diapherotrites archaeon]|nr:MBL fold metallo-hydrolase [Candidatus Diapherotrites archaeon]